MLPQTLLLGAPLILLLGAAAVVDVRERRIPNWLTLGLAVLGLAQSFMPHRLVDPPEAIIGLLVGFALGLVLLLLGGMGGGDLKLIAAVGAWIGAIQVLWVFAICAIVAMLMAIVGAFTRGQARALLASTAALAVQIVHAKRLNAVGEEADEFRSVGKPLPFAVPMLLATAFVLLGLPLLK
jgi:prepilin peptidase CpaA